MESEYKRFFNFLGAWFADSDFEGKTEIDIVKEFKEIVSSSELKTIILEAEAVKSQINKYWIDVRDRANVYFANEHEAEIWLDKLIQLLKQN